MSWALLLQFVCSLVPAILVSVRLLKKGTSKLLKRKVFYRHLVFVLVYIISSFNIKFGTFDRQNLTKSLWLADAIIVIFTCVSMSMIRLLEPYVFQTFTEFVRGVCCFERCKKTKDRKPKVKFSEESLCSFLNSAMNIEFVSLILVGIQSSYFD